MTDREQQLESELAEVTAVANAAQRHARDADTALTQALARAEQAESERRAIVARLRTALAEAGCRVTVGAGPDPDAAAWAEWAALRQSLDSGQVEPLLDALAASRARVSELTAENERQRVHIERLAELAARRGFAINTGVNPHGPEADDAVDLWLKAEAERDVERARREALVTALLQARTDLRTWAPRYSVPIQMIDRALAAAVPLEAPKEHPVVDAIEHVIEAADAPRDRLAGYVEQQESGEDAEIADAVSRHAAEWFDADDEPSVEAPTEKEPLCKSNPRTDGRSWEPWEGNGPCQDCGERNVVWSTDSETWNRVVPDGAGLLCPSCFIRRAFAAGLTNGWKISAVPLEAPHDDGLCRARPPAPDYVKQQGPPPGPVDPPRWCDRPRGHAGDHQHRTRWTHPGPRWPQEGDKG